MSVKIFTHKVDVKRTFTHDTAQPQKTQRNTSHEVTITEEKNVSVVMLKGKAFLCSDSILLVN